MDDDYSTTVVIDGRTFHVCADTGSVELAVAGAAAIGCDSYIDAAAAPYCNASATFYAQYGSGSWRGIECSSEVHLGDLAVNFTYAAMLNQSCLLSCPRQDPAQFTALPHMVRPDKLVEGILGLGFSRRGSPPFLKVLFDRYRGAVDPVFGMQCCGYSMRDRDGGDGFIDFGAFDPDHYEEVSGEGHFEWAPVSQRKWWDIRLRSLSIAKEDLVVVDGGTFDEEKDGGEGRSKEPKASNVSAVMLPAKPVNLMPPEVAQTAVWPTTGFPQTIVDSGTSGLFFEPRTFAALLDVLMKRDWVRKDVLEEEAGKKEEEKKKKQKRQVDDLSAEERAELLRSFWYASTCLPVSEWDVDLLPTLELGVYKGDPDAGDDSSFTLQVPPCRYVSLVQAGRGGCGDFVAPEGTPPDAYYYTSALGDAGAGNNMVLGQSVFEEYYVAHDMGAEPRIGFAPIKGCPAASRCNTKHAKPGIAGSQPAAVAAPPPAHIESPKEVHKSAGKLFAAAAIAVCVAIIIPCVYRYVRKRRAARARGAYQTIRN